MNLYEVEFETPYAITDCVREQFKAKSYRAAYKHVQGQLIKYPTCRLALLRLVGNPIPIEVFRR